MCFPKPCFVAGGIHVNPCSTQLCQRENLQTIMPIGAPQAMIYHAISTTPPGHPLLFLKSIRHQTGHTIAATMVQSSHHIPACETHLDNILNPTAMMVRMIKITLVATILGSAFSVRSVPGGVVKIGGMSDSEAIAIFLSSKTVSSEAPLTCRRRVDSCSSVR